MISHLNSTSNYNWSNVNNLYPSDLGVHVLVELSLQQVRQERDPILPDVSLLFLSKDQRFAYNLIITSLFNYIEYPDTV